MQGRFRVFPLWNHFGHAGNLADHFLQPHLLDLVELLPEVIDGEVASHIGLRAVERKGLFDPTC